MKRILALFTLIIGIAASAAGQTILWLDYCGGQYNSNQRQIAVAGDVEVAIRLTEAQLASLGGNEVSQLAMAFPTTHPSEMTMWIRSERNGENLREVAVDKIVAKWNNFDLATPLPLTGSEKELWVGATFTQKYASNKYLSMAGATAEDGCYYRVLGADGGEWQNKAGEDVGSFCIRMGVTGDNIPVHDLSLSKVSTSALSYGTGEDVPISARIINHGADEAVNPIVRCSINGEVVADVTLEKTIAPSEIADVKFNVPTTSVTAPGIYAFSFELLWADGQPDTKPANNTDAINIGLVQARHNMALENVTTTARLCERGSNVTVSGTIVNNDYFVVQNPRIGYSINGGEQQKKAISCKLATGESKDFAFAISTKGVEEDGPITINLELLWNDGSVDDYPADNTAQVQVTLTSAAPNRRMVVEEGTGTWCGWCVRGIVGMHDMAAKYPDQFIGIAVHNGDEMQHASYATYLSGMGINGYPGSIVNRQQGAVDPSFGNLEKRLKSMPPYSELGIDVDANLSATTYDLVAHVKPLVDIPVSNYHVIFVVTEDNISGVQSNYYSGGGSGAMGGFEKLGSSVKVDFLDVARAIFPNAAGTGNPSLCLPSEMKAGESYDITLSVAASQAKVSKIENANIIALLIDDTMGGQVANAAKFSQKLVGIHTVLADDNAAPAEIYDLQGRRVAAPVNGINIVGGKKVIK